jgi:hypothetical protein
MMKHFRLGALVAACLALSLPAFALDLSLDGSLRGNCGTVASTGNGTADTATLNNKCGVVTTESLTAPTASEFTLTLTNSAIAAADIPLVTISNGTNTSGLVALERATVTASTLTVVVRQMSTASLNGTLKVNYFIIKP